MTEAEREFDPWEFVYEGVAGYYDGTNFMPWKGVDKLPKDDLEAVAKAALLVIAQMGTLDALGADGMRWRTELLSEAIAMFHGGPEKSPEELAQELADAERELERASDDEDEDN